MSFSPEDTCKMTREDVMRELELLPVWKLRAPLQVQPIAETEQPSLAEIPKQRVADNDAVIIVSEDKKWAFVLPNLLTGESANLFNNILRALKIKSSQIIHSQQLKQDIESSGATIIIAMGEIAAQKLLTSAQSIADLRGKVHLINAVQVVVTYHPDALLQHLPYKAQAWDDLCLAFNHLSA